MKEKLNQEKNLNQEKGLFKLEVRGGGGNKDSVVSRKELASESQEPEFGFQRSRLLIETRHGTMYL